MQISSLPSDTNDVDTNCAAVWQEMPRADTPIAQDLADKIAKQYKLEVSFHTHDGTTPSDPVLFGVNYCGNSADTYFAGRDWEKSVLDVIAAAHAGTGAKQATSAAALVASR